MQGARFFSYLGSVLLFLALFNSQVEAKGKKSSDAGDSTTPQSLTSKPINTIKDYNDDLPYWGTTWQPWSGEINEYHASFYTGFAMRSEYPERIHVRQARGNQTRMTVILDEKTVSDYLFDLVKRYNFYQKVTNLSGKRARFTLLPADHAYPHLSAFSQIIESPQYGILKFVEQAQSGHVSAEEIYAKSLAVLTALNSSRVFNLHINLKSEFLKWKKFIQLGKESKADFATLALDSLLWGRVNYAQKPSDEVLQKLNAAVQLAEVGDQAQFLSAALELFKVATGDKYNFKVLNSEGKWTSALQCSDVQQHCTLNYPEFTTIYPTGTVRETTHDDFGNPINSLASPGLWNYHDFKNGHNSSVDTIPSEPYYGWIAKMFYDPAGNAFHNPGIKFSGISKAEKDALGAPANHQILWAVKRGDVSHGCSRLASGHAWEMRHILPVESEKMTQVNVFIHRPQDFDLYDVNGDGTLKVMGVNYFISYDFKGTYESRQAQGLKTNSDGKLDFYKRLYGNKNVFDVTADGQYVFTNPSVALPGMQDYQKRSVSTHFKLPGTYALYEQPYEKDKIQLYNPSPAASAGNPYIRLMGRIRGCAPTADKVACGEAAFDDEAKKLTPEAYN